MHPIPASAKQYDGGPIEGNLRWTEDFLSLLNERLRAIDGLTGRLHFHVSKVCGWVDFSEPPTEKDKEIRTKLPFTDEAHASLARLSETEERLRILVEHIERL